MKEYSVVRPKWSALTIFGAIGFTASLIVHLLTYVGIAPQQVTPAVWLLHIGIFAVFLPFVFRMKEWEEKTGTFRRRFLWREVLQHFPRWGLVLTELLFVYAGVNFFLAMPHLPDGGSQQVSDAAEVALYTARGFSGHWLLFYALPTLGLLYVPRRASVT